MPDAHHPQHWHPILPSGLWPVALRPVAYIYIDGLAVCGFKQDHWQVDFLHRANHKLTMEIDGSDPLTLGTSVTELRFYAGGESAYNTFPKGFFFQGESFDRFSANHANDFRWVINIASARDMPPGRARWGNTSPFGPTKVSAYNAVLFTAALTKTLYRVPVGKDPNENEEEMIELGKANDVIVAVVFSNDSRLLLETFRDDGTSTQRRLQESAEPHIIKLMNMRPENQHHHPDSEGPDTTRRWLKGDFELYYGPIVADAKWALWGEPNEKEKKNGRIDCDSIALIEGSE